MISWDLFFFSFSSIFSKEITMSVKGITFSFSGYQGMVFMTSLVKTLVKNLLKVSAFSVSVVAILHFTVCIVIEGFGICLSFLYNLAFKDFLCFPTSPSCLISRPSIKDITISLPSVQISLISYILLFHYIVPFIHRA